MSTGEERRQGAPDLLGDILRLAGQEGALQGHALRAFADALRARASLVIAERVSDAEAQVQTLEKENAWRQETVARLEEANAWCGRSIAELEKSRRALEQEVAWRRETGARLDAEISWRREAAAQLDAEIGWRREMQARLGQEVQDLRAMLGTADQEHKNLLDHHRAVLGRITTELRALAEIPAWRIGRARRRLLALAALLRGDVP